MLACLPAHGAELKFWTVTPNSDAAGNALNKAAEDFSAANPDTPVKIESRGIDEHKSAMRIAASSDQGPDIFYIWAGLGLGGEFIKAGMSEPLDKYYTQYKWSDRFVPAAGAFADLYPGGKQGMPYTFRGEVVYYNKELFAKVGITTPPATYDELVAEGARLPAIGVVVYPEDAAAALANLPVLEELGPQGLLFHFDPTVGHGSEAMAAFAALANAYPAETTLECVVAAEGGSRADVESELARTAALAREAGLRLDAVAVSPSVDRRSTPPGSAWPDCPPLEAVYAAARQAFPAQKLGGGMFSYFTELNRKRVPADAIDFVTHCTNPIVHAADDLSVMQTLEALPFVTKSVRALYNDKPYRIGPSTIAMRQNPYGATTKENPHGGRIPMANRDPRHNALFGAAWAVGYAARVAPAELEQLTISSFAGAFGLLAGAGEPAPEGAVRPLFHVVKALSDMAGLAGVEVVADDTGRAASLAARGADGRLRILCANLTPSVLRLDLSALPLEKDAAMSVLDAEAVASGRRTPIQSRSGAVTLESYSVLIASL